MVKRKVLGSTIIAGGLLATALGVNNLVKTAPKVDEAERNYGRQSQEYAEVARQNDLGQTEFVGGGLGTLAGLSLVLSGRGRKRRTLYETTERKAA